MKRKAVLLIGTTVPLVIALLLAACSPGYSDPYGQRAAADAAIEATEAAWAERARGATLEAAQTQESLQGAAALLNAQATATQQAFDFQATATEAAYLLAVTQSAATAQAEATLTAYPKTATPLAATQAAIVREAARAERRAYWSQATDPIIAIAPTVFWFSLLALLIAGVVLAYRRLMPVLELRLRTVPRGAHDAPLILYPNMVIDPDRNFGPALKIDANGATSSGYAPTPELQAGVVARDQAVDAVRALPLGERERKRAERLLGVLPYPQLPQAAPVKVEVIEPGDSPQLGGWLAEVERKLLTDGEGEP